TDIRRAGPVVNVEVRAGPAGEAAVGEHENAAAGAQVDDRHARRRRTGGGGEGKRAGDVAEPAGIERAAVHRDAGGIVDLVVATELAAAGVEDDGTGVAQRLTGRSGGAEHAAVDGRRPGIGVVAGEDQRAC